MGLNSKANIYNNEFIYVQHVLDGILVWEEFTLPSTYGSLAKKKLCQKKVQHEKKTSFAVQYVSAGRKEILLQ